MGFSAVKLALFDVVAVQSQIVKSTQLANACIKVTIQLGGAIYA
jgi:hypothetical protein